MYFKRGDICWIDQSMYKPPVGSVQKPGRPGIVVSNDANNHNANTVEIVYLTGQPKKALPTHCIIESSGKTSIALCEQITTVSTEQLRDYVGQCTDEEMAAIDRCLAISLGLITSQETNRAFAEEEIAEMERTIHRQETMLTVANARADLLQQMYNDLLTRTIA